MSSISSQTPAIELREVSRSFGSMKAVDRVSVQIAQGEFFSLLGPSGCGKTTILRMIAGLDQPDSGEVFLRGRPMKGVPANERDVNTVFQSYALFPHLTVEENVAFGPRMKKIDKFETRKRVGEAMEMVEITALAHRKPDQLSGGQKQRVALARAIVNRPGALLLDEPLAALDARLRKQLQGELQGLQNKLGLTFIYVTHDQDEALSMSSRIAVMNQGVIEQLGAPEEIYERPCSAYVAEFIGAANVLPVSHAAGNAGVIEAQTALGAVQLAGHAGTTLKFVAIRPEHIRLSRAPVLGGNQYKARVAQAAYNGAEREFKLESGQTMLRVRQSSAALFCPGIGEEIVLELPADKVLPLLR